MVSLAMILGSSVATGRLTDLEKLLHIPWPKKIINRLGWVIPWPEVIQGRLWFNCFRLGWVMTTCIMQF